MQIVNLHLEGTVEAGVYRALKGRIRMFEQVVGKLQPILASRHQRDKARASAVAALQQTQEIRGLDLDDDLQDPDAIQEAMKNMKPLPLTLKDLEAILSQPQLLPPGCAARRIGAHDLAWTQPGLEDEFRITCDPDYYTEHSESCEFWVPGSPLFPLQQARALSGGAAGPCSRQAFQKALQLD